MNSSAPIQFELSGGALCLDFANTWADRGRPQTDKLRGYGDLLAFAEQAGLLDSRQLEALRGLARGSTPAAHRALRRARKLREAVYQVFSSRVAGGTVEEEELESLLATWSASARRMRLEPVSRGYAWSWAGLDQAADALLGPIAHSAVELLTGGELSRLRECEGGDCTWLFLDASRNRSRRWCSMATCGNRAKVRRHYRRHKGNGA